MTDVDLQLAKFNTNKYIFAEQGCFPPFETRQTTLSLCQNRQEFDRFRADGHQSSVFHDKELLVWLN